MDKVVISLYHHSQEVSYEILTLAEAKERLNRSMSPHFWYGVPTWQFNKDGSTSISVLLRLRKEALQDIKTAI
jgi:hypothetical protein